MVVGDNVTVKCGVQLWDGLRVEDNVCIGPNVTFCNDKYPRSKAHDFKLYITTVKKGASIGANSTILPGVTIGENSIIAAGSVVTKDVADNMLYIKGEQKPLMECKNINCRGGVEFKYNFYTNFFAKNLRSKSLSSYIYLTVSSLLARGSFSFNNKLSFLNFYYKISHLVHSFSIQLKQFFNQFSLSLENCTEVKV